MVKKTFGLTYNGIKTEKGNIKKNTTFFKKKKRVMTVHGKYIIYKKPGYKKSETYYYIFPKNALKRGSLITYT